jgi:hypothetical protein
MGFAFEHRGREPERTFRNDRYSDFQRGPVHEDPRVTEERERALLRAAFAASRKLDPQEATRPALAEKLNGRQAAGLVLQRSPIQEQEPETIQRQVSYSLAECEEMFEECNEKCRQIPKTREGNRRRSMCWHLCTKAMGDCRARAQDRDQEALRRDMLLVLVIAGLLALVDGPLPIGDAAAVALLARYGLRFAL